jgi:hypothetical protein
MLDGIGEQIWCTPCISPTLKNNHNIDRVAGGKIMAGVVQKYCLADYK